MLYLHYTNLIIHTYFMHFKHLIYFTFIFPVLFLSDIKGTNVMFDYGFDYLARILIITFLSFGFYDIKINGFVTDDLEEVDLQICVEGV